MIEKRLNRLSSLEHLRQEWVSELVGPLHSAEIKSMQAVMHRAMWDMGLTGVLAWQVVPFIVEAGVSFLSSHQHVINELLRVLPLNENKTNSWLI